jgi:hypothetical protein
MGPELFYTVTEKELLVIVFGLQKFRTILLGHRVVIHTDHYALKFLKQCRLLNDRLTRWTLMLNEFNKGGAHQREGQRGCGYTITFSAQRGCCSHQERRSSHRRCHSNFREIVHHSPVYVFRSG